MNQDLPYLPNLLNIEGVVGGGVEGGVDWDLNWSKTTIKSIETVSTTTTCGRLTEVLLTGTVEEVFLVRRG